VKLRILGDTVRLRLAQSDVHALRETGRVEDSTHFGPDAVLTYAVERAEGAGEMTAVFSAGTICVRIPSEHVRRWADSDEVSLRGEQPIDDARTLALLVEKDFKCAMPREGEEDDDAFENPNVTC
jgi:hypothetical protein